MDETLCSWCGSAPSYIDRSLPRVLVQLVETMSLCGVSEARTLSNVQFSFVQSMVLSAAVKLKIADIIAAAGEDATLSAEEIAAQFPTARASLTNLKRVLRLLVLHDIFRADYGELQNKHA